MKSYDSVELVFKSWNGLENGKFGKVVENLRVQVSQKWCISKEFDMYNI